MKRCHPRRAVASPQAAVAATPDLAPNWPAPPAYGRRGSFCCRRHGAKQAVDVDEASAEQWLHWRLWHGALHAEVSARRYAGHERAVAIHEVSDADHRGLRRTRARAGVTREALVDIAIELIGVDRMRDERRLLGIVADLAYVGIRLRQQARSRSLLAQR